MTGAEILALIGDAKGWGMAALFAWLWMKERDRGDTSQNARIADWKEKDERGIRAQEATVHALDKIEELVRSMKP